MQRRSLSSVISHCPLSALSVGDEPAESHSRWTIIPLSTPRVWRRCRGCGDTRAFASSDRFRINANQRRLDVWLIYRCVHCEATWNREIFARVSPEAIERDLYGRLLGNDRSTAWRCAFDVAGLRARGLRVDNAVDFRVDRIRVGGADGGCIRVGSADGGGIRVGSADGGPRCIHLDMAYPCPIRLDRLLSGQLAVSRKRLSRWFDAGLIRVVPEVQRPLRKPVRHGQIILVDPRVG
ncbi:MAG: DUF1062 domain-containing protein [Myxococcota bacterium]